MNKPKQPLSVPPSAAAAKGPSKIDLARQAMANSSLSVSAPGARPGATAAPMIGSATVLTIPIRDIDFYDRNPRTDPNEKFEDIKESIRLAGLDSIMPVMRLPDSGRYVVAKGGNTRLKALKELFEETQDAKFEHITAQIVPFRGHTAAIADHLKENTLRGAMSYFDKAKACLDLYKEIAADTGKEPGIRELVNILRNDYGLTTGMDHATLGRYLHVAQHFYAVRFWMNNISSKALIPPYNSLVRLALKLEKSEAEAHAELHAALDRFASRLSLEPSQQDAQLEVSGELPTPVFDVQACIRELQASMCVFLGLTAYQLDFALGALEVNTNAGKEDILTSAAPAPATRAATSGLGGTQLGIGEDQGQGRDNGDGDDEGLEKTAQRAKNSGSQSPLEIAKALGRETIEARNAGQDWNPSASHGGNSGSAGGGASSLAPSPSASSTKRQKPQTVEEVLDRIIDTVTQFCDLCGVGELCTTSLSLPSGYVMDLPPEELILPSQDMPDARIRVGGWWMAAMLAKHFDEEHCRLFPTTALWRSAWVREDPELNQAVERPDPFHVVQQHLGAVLGDDGRPALQLEFMFEVIRHPVRAQAFAELTLLIQTLDELRNGG